MDVVVGPNSDANDIGIEVIEIIEIDECWIVISIKNKNRTSALKV